MIIISRLTSATDQATEELNVLLPQLSDHVRPVTPAVLGRIIASDDQLFIATDDGRIIGAALLVVNVQLVRTKSWLEDLVVDDTYRGQGVGKQLIEAVVTAARKTEAASLDISSKASRSALYGMYESMGFVRRDTNLFRIDLAS